MLDAPAGLGGSFTGGELRIGSAAMTMDEPLTLKLNVMEGDDLRASLPVRITEKTGGGKGVILDGLDETGWLKIQLKVNPSAHEFNATFRLNPSPTVPAALVPLFRWMSACRPPGRLVIVWPEGLEMSSELETDLLDEGGVGVVEALAYLQERSQVYFPYVPPTSSRGTADHHEQSSAASGGAPRLYVDIFHLEPKELGTRP